LGYGDSGEHISTNFGKGGMKNLVEQRLKSKALSSSCFTFEPSNTQVCAVNVRQSALRPAEKGSDLERTGGQGLDEDGQLALAEHLQEVTGWDCPVFISKTIAETWESWSSEDQVRVWATGDNEQKEKNLESNQLTAEASGKTGPGKSSRGEKGKGRPYLFGRDIDLQYDKGKVTNMFWSQEIMGLTIADFFGSIRKDVEEEILEKLRRQKLVKGGGAVVGAVFIAGEDRKSEDMEEDDWGNRGTLRKEKEEAPTYQAYVHAIEHWTTPIDREELQNRAKSHQLQANCNISNELTEMCWARGCSTCWIEMRGVPGLVPALLDSGSEVNLMSMAVYRSGGWPVERECGWEVNSVNDTNKKLWGARERVMVCIGNLVEPVNIFVHETLPQSVILGQPFITELRMETKVLDDGIHVAKLKSRDGKQWFSSLQ
jgi:hypothetical protein